MTDTQTFSADVYAQRLHAAQKAAADKGIDLLLIGTGPDFAYLTAVSYTHLTLPTICSV